MWIWEEQSIWATSLWFSKKHFPTPPWKPNLPTKQSVSARHKRRILAGSNISKGYQSKAHLGRAPSPHQFPALRKPNLGLVYGEPWNSLRATGQLYTTLWAQFHCPCLGRTQSYICHASQLYDFQFLCCFGFVPARHTHFLGWSGCWKWMFCPLTKYRLKDDKSNTTSGDTGPGYESYPQFVGTYRGLSLLTSRGASCKGMIQPESQNCMALQCPDMGPLVLSQPNSYFH